MEYKMFIDANFLHYGDSLLYPSGMEIASISCEVADGKKYWVSLRTQGAVCIYFKGEVYKDVSQFPDELLEHIRKGDYQRVFDSDELDVRENNWWEWCMSDGDGYVSDSAPQEYESLGAVAADLTDYLIDLIKAHEEM